MFRGKLWKKLLITFLSVTLVFFLLINYPMKYWLYEKESERVEKELKSASGYCDMLLRESMDNEAFVKSLGMFDAYSDIRVMIANGDGIISSDTRRDNIGRDVYKVYPGLRKKFYSRTRMNGLIRETSSVYVTEVHATGGIDNLVLLVYDNANLNNYVEEGVYRLNILGMVFTGIFLVVMAIYGIYYTRVIRYMIKTTAHYADGKFEERQTRRKFSDENQELANAIDYLAEKTEGLVDYQKTFIANVSHDFRSPLTSIRGYTVAMKDGTIPYENQAKYLDIILFETDRLAGLTQNLLDLNEFDNNAIRLNLTDFNLCGMVKQSAATFESICASKKLKMRLIFSEKEIWVKADKQKIQQVLHNLIDNAIKFSNEDSKVEVTVTAREGTAYVSVRDYGIGIPKESINQVWERFYKTDLSRGKDKKGTGLGLSITKQIINAHDEKIVVESTVGEGTEFTFTLRESERAE